MTATQIDIDRCLVLQYVLSKRKNNQKISNFSGIFTRAKRSFRGMLCQTTNMDIEVFVMITTRMVNYIPT